MRERELPLRAQIQLMVAQGQSDDAIKASLVREHTKRILTSPEGTERTWLFITPWVAGLAGFGALILILRRSLRTPAQSALSGVSPVPIDETWLA